MIAKRKWWMGLALSAASATLPGPAGARHVWNCTYEGSGTGPAHYVTRLERRGVFLVEPHWPSPVAYRILVDSRDILIAVRATTTPPSFRRDAGGAATVLFINKLTGRMRRAGLATGQPDEQSLIGICERR